MVRAKEEYLVTDGDLSGLKRLTKPNPKSPDFKPMQLFLQRQVIERSLRKWKSLEALEAEKRRRKVERAEGSWFSTSAPCFSLCFC